MGLRTITRNTQNKTKRNDNVWYDSTLQPYVKRSLEKVPVCRSMITVKRDQDRKIFLNTFVCRDVSKHPSLTL